MFSLYPKDEDLYFKCDSVDNQPLDWLALKQQCDSGKPVAYSSRDHMKVVVDCWKAGFWKRVHVADPLPVGDGDLKVMSYEQFSAAPNSHRDYYNCRLEPR